MEIVKYTPNLRGVSNKKPSRVGTVNSALVTKKQVRDMLRSQETKEEMKLFDTNQNAGGVDFSGTVSALSNLTQGIASNQRDGDQIELDHLELRCNWGAADATNLCRILVVQYFPSATPQVTTFLQYSGSGAAPLSQYARGTSQDYAILYDSGPLNLVLNADNTQKAFSVLNIKPRRHRQTFNATLTTGSNQLYVVSVSDSGAASHPTLSYNARLYYNDV